MVIEDSRMAHDIIQAIERLAVAAEGIQEQLRRLADHFDPPPPDIVNTAFVANKLGCTKIWVARMAADRLILASCVLPGTGNGKVWKFYRSRIEKWLETR